MCFFSTRPALLGPALVLLAVLLAGPAHAQTTTVITRINAGGLAVTAGGVDWSEDRFFDAGRPTNPPAITEIDNTDADEIYLTARTATGRRERFAYRIPLPANGLYTVRLHFAEIYWGVEGGQPGGVGSRVFDVDAEGQTVLDDFDIIAQAGPATAVIREFIVPVADDTLDIGFFASVDQPLVNAIEVTTQQMGTATDDASPLGVRVGVPMPNPSSSGTAIPLDLAHAASVEVAVYDLLGRKVGGSSRSLTAGPGHLLPVDVRNVAPGVYLYRVRVTTAGEVSVSSGTLTVVR